MDQKDRMDAHLKHTWQLVAMSSAFKHTQDEHKNELLRGRLWIGDCISSEEPFLLKHQITHVVSLNDPGIRVPLYYEGRGIVYHRIRVEDNPNANIKQYFDEACRFIHDAFTGQKEGDVCNVLVHCQAGVSRSAIICMAYLIKYHGLSFMGAYGVVKAAREIICPNTGFLEQLMEWEKNMC